MSAEAAASLVEELARRLMALDREIEGVRAEIARLPAPRNCTLDYRWVKNKQKVKYWYWYAVCCENGERRSVYIGKMLRPEFVARVDDEVKAKMLAKRLRRLVKAKALVERRLARVEALLASALAVLDRVGVREHVEEEPAEASLTPGVESSA